VALVILGSTEYRNRLVTRYYETFLGRSAGAGDLGYWVGALAGGARSEQVMALILASEEYYFRPHAVP
jgi:hypothetical protein